MLFETINNQIIHSNNYTMSSQDIMIALREEIKKKINNNNYLKLSTIPAEMLYSVENTGGKILEGGDNIFSEQTNLIKSASHEILLQTFAWESHAAGSRIFLKALEELQESRRRIQGDHQSLPILNVCIIVHYAAGIAGKIMERTRQPSVQNQNNRIATNRTQCKNKYVLVNFNVDPKIMKISVKKFQSHLLTTMHSKSLVIDGKKVLITGANYQARNHGQLGCFDLGFIFEGDIADATRGNFISCWESSHAMRYEGSDIQLDLQKKKYRLESQNDKYIPIILAARKSSNLSQLDCVQNMAFQSAFDHSKRNINILTPNLNDPFIIDCIVQALRRGVCIKIILSKNFNDSRENNIIAGGTNDTTVKNLYFNFARYKNHLQIKWYANKKGQVIIGSSANSSHAKYASFDNEVAIIGSANLDKQSIRHARELNFVVGHKTTVLEWDQIMYQKVFDRSKNID